MFNLTIHLKLLSSTIVILLSLILMILPISKTVEMSAMVFMIYFSLLLPSIIYSFISIKMSTIESIIIPGITLVLAEYYFFHNFSTWIASDANAAIALLFIPIYLIIFLLCSYGLAYLIFKIRHLEK